jgi:hypothetical protein
MKRLVVLSFVIGLLGVPIEAQAQHAYQFLRAPFHLGVQEEAPPVPTEQPDPYPEWQRQQEVARSLAEHNAIMNQRTRCLAAAMSGRYCF